MSINRLAAAFLVVLFVSCSGQPPTEPQPVVPPPPPVDPPAAPTQWTVSGTVWVYGANGFAPAQSGSVFGWVERAKSGQTTGRVNIGADGRYQFSVGLDTTRVRVQGPRYQPCAVTVEPAGNVTADVYTVSDLRRLGANLPPELLTRQPILTGVVYEQTPTGRVPLSDVWVTLDSIGGLGNLIADTLTDADGRYVLCGVPFLPGLEVVAGKDGFQVFESSGDLTGKTTFDFEMRRK